MLDLWYTENHTDEVKFSIKVKKHFYSTKSEFQQIDFFESDEFGTFFTLDGLMMVNEKDEFVLHEIKNYFGFGDVKINIKDHHGTRKEFRVRGLKNLQKIVKFFDEDVSYLDFVFQLSGNQHAMNFRWLENSSKKRIIDGIPDFIERILDKRIDKGLKENDTNKKNYLQTLDEIYTEE